jgi:thymidine phosphorylase
MVALGTDAGVKSVALVTAMDVPLGLTAGNALEVRESVEVLAGGGPKDVVELTLALAREMLTLVGIEKDPADVLRDGSAMDVWRRMITAQGGNPDAPLPVAAHREVVVADKSGVVASMDALAVGVAAWRLGAGRSRQGEVVQAGAGIEIHAKPGEEIVKGSPIFTLHTETPERFPHALEALQGGWSIGKQAGATLPLIVDRITA